ncbi:ABC transporter permease [Shouchella clausii]|uniref:Bacitracin ABC transporter permease n=1 Tax=Shouchella clausii TaxID=79880 RepID=A0A268S2B6_SHOCL|nr:ABC transporter permease [Shouchella clausii]PAD43351.1 bacitracin ABC transporter permease [Bacillus sp. 7520-S]SPT78586.1 peptide ABC transporter permease [Niallia circulans]MBU8596784.1 ABC transporter permease [Shouchella clausii]MCM3551000.1 ABC transporter permease [Shouchella clausii]MCY1104182.1 ABC transporter permease [Shouchella clausii]
MNTGQLIMRNLRKNSKTYGLYIFSLTFSVALYFAFVTLQYDPALDEAAASVKGAAAIRSASVLLVAIIAIFLLYANRLFLKRRSKEIGLFQLVGMRKGRIFGLLSGENVLVYFGALAVGVFIGFYLSKLATVSLYSIIGVETAAKLHFSGAALTQTLLVFAAIYILMMAFTYVYIRKQTILSLFQIKTKTETITQGFRAFEIAVGILGIVLIGFGYWLSSKLFEGQFVTQNELFFAMTIILAACIIGTLLFYKGTVSFVAKVIRRKKDGYLNIREVMSLSSLMFRMKSNAVLLTVITTVSALAIGLLSLSYITYYSAEKSAQQWVPTDFAFVSGEDAEAFKIKLDHIGVDYQERTTEFIQGNVNIEEIIASSTEMMTGTVEEMAITSAAYMTDVHVSTDEAVLTGYNDLLQRFVTFKEEGDIVIELGEETISQQYRGLKKEFVIPNFYPSSGMPTVVVNEETFASLKKQQEAETSFGIDIVEESAVVEANTAYQEMDFQEQSESQWAMATNQKAHMGLYMFIVAFLGLTFLITSGCILYFKQVDETEGEKHNYTILRKLGFNRRQLEKGSYAKQLFAFGIPLLLGLSHSYFAVQSGWFFFGGELWTPMLLVMAVYTALYSIFALLSVWHTKKVIKEAL